MAPFMNIGRKLRNLVRWPALRLVARPVTCGDCLTCARECPMSVDLHQMVQPADMEDVECNLCGTASTAAAKTRSTSPSAAASGPTLLSFVTLSGSEASWPKRDSSLRSE
jgi:L-lactate utilization protein LutB